MRYILLIGLAGLLVACSDGSDDPAPRPVPDYDFSSVDLRLQQFIDDSERYDGVSITVVDRSQGQVHKQSLGDHDTDIVFLLASVSKVPTASLMMALHEDPELGFDISAPVRNYLPWEGIFGNRSVEQMLSNTSGIPGLSSIGQYGPHLCQFSPLGTLEDCARTLYSTPLVGTVPPGTVWDYGGSQWQLAGAVAEQVTNSSWRQAFDRYIAGPCQLDVMDYGNNISAPGSWNGSPDSLVGLDNPLVEGGAISDLDDYAAFLLMHLRDGYCGETQVLSEEGLAFMQQDRGEELGQPYGLGWWILAGNDGESPTVFWDPGAFGSVAWIDTEREIGGFFAIDDYTSYTPIEPVAFVLAYLIPLVAQAVDEARIAVEIDD